MADQDRIVQIALDGDTLGRRTPQIEHERRVAIFDLIEDNHFAPVGSDGGPYVVRLSLAEGRLVFCVTHPEGDPVTTFPLSLRPFSRLIRDYLMICESYYAAIRQASPSGIETIDMGRRGLHDEGARLMCERLTARAAIDHDTGRRLFTLLCALHVR